MEAEGPLLEARSSAVQADVESYFDREASFWSDVYSGTDVSSIVYQRRLNRAVSWVQGLRLASDTRVLEVGCGAGYTALALAQQGLRVDATDATARMVTLTHRAAKRAGVTDRIDTNRVDGHSLPFEAESFPLVVSLGVIPWLESPLTVLLEVARVLQPGGHLIVTADNRWRLITLFDPLLNPALAPLRSRAKAMLTRLGMIEEAAGHAGSFMHSRREFEALLGRAGLDIVAESMIGFGPFTFMRRQALPGRLSNWLDDRLQALADRRERGLRSVAAQHMVLARKP